MACPPPFSQYPSYYGEGKRNCGTYLRATCCSKGRKVQSGGNIRRLIPPSRDGSCGLVVDGARRVAARPVPAGSGLGCCCAVALFIYRSRASFPRCGKTNAPPFSPPPSSSSPLHPLILTQETRRHSTHFSSSLRPLVPSPLLLRRALCIHTGMNL